MRKSVLSRKMFMQPPVKKNKGGIVSLFEDIVGEDMDEFSERRPDNPEILANNIRGDIKSLDERYEELAEVLGDAAYETPEEVLVYMQTQMPKAQQQPQPGQAPMPTNQGPAQGGIGTMAQGTRPTAPQQGAPAQPPGGIESLVAPPQAPMQAPQQPVQRAQGSGPMGEVSDPLAAAMENFIDSGGTFEQLLAMGAGQAPVQRADGSPRTGERVDPRFRDPLTRNYFIPQGMEGPIPTTQQAGGVRANASALERQLIEEGVLDADPNQRASAQPKSRPLTPDEMRARLLEREGRGLNMLRNFDDAMRRFNIDPNVARNRVGQVLNAVPGLNKLGKLTKGVSKTDAAVGALGLGSGAYLLNKLGEDEQADPYMRDHPLIGNIPIDGEPRAPKELVREEINYPAVAEVDLTKPTPTGEEIDAAFAEEDRLPEDIRLNVPSKRVEAAVDGLSNFEKRVRARADIYKKLLGDDPNMRQAQAHFILAEAGLALAGAKGRSLGERVSKGLRGVPSALGALAAQETQLNRAATSAAISAIEQQDRDMQAGAIQLQKSLLSSSNKGLGRQQEIEAKARTLMAGYNMDQGQAVGVATLLVDKGAAPDELSNLRDPLGGIITYGPQNQPLRPTDIGFIPEKHPYVRTNEPTPTPIVDVAGMKKAREDINQMEKMLVTLQGAKNYISQAVGPMNVLTRGITNVTQPLFGDIGPFSADKSAVTRHVDNANRVLQQVAAINPEKVSVYEQKENKKLEINGNSFFTSPDIEIGKLMGMETFLINEINRNKYMLNPRDTQFRQLETPNLGSKNDPVPMSAYTLLPEFFAARPTATLYIKRPDGSTIGVTRDWAISQGLMKQ